MKHDGKTSGEKLASALGWFSVGLGLSQLFAPRAMARLIGVEDQKDAMRWFGARELSTGIGILTQSRPDPWIWSRVAGDCMDLAALGVALKSETAKPGRIALAAAAVAGVAAADIYCSRKLAQANLQSQSIKLMQRIQIERSPQDVYNYWRGFERLPSFMDHLESVRKISDNVWHWVAKGPMGLKLEWDAQVVNDKPGELIAWSSLPGSEVRNAGSVRFEKGSGGHGTQMNIEIIFGSPAGGGAIGRLFGKLPEHQIATDLRKLKQLMETGEIASPEAGKSTPTYDEVVRS